ncbi:hypothetical protein NDN08_002764 [Rhodosorus marinus]|uniref:C2H2-type domain-containing protein n=1 Tax=Rhodosorus marinus TaxID=101924 RepID=A0AAV8UXE7_9RHOD|nr:hypothetical protein NDN08_002764 [Rhodosorus marinus]
MEPETRPDQWIPDEMMMQWLYCDVPDLPFRFERGSLLQSNRMKLRSDDLELPANVWTPLFVPQYAQDGVLFGTVFGGRSLLSAVFPMEVGNSSRYCIDCRGEFMTLYFCHRSEAGSIELLRVQLDGIGDTKCSNAVYLQSNPDEIFFKFQLREKRLCPFCSSRGFVCECSEGMRIRALADVEHGYQRTGLSFSKSNDHVTMCEGIAEAFSLLFSTKYSLWGTLAMRKDFGSTELIHSHCHFPKSYSFMPSGRVVDTARIGHAQMYISSHTPNSALFLTDSSGCSEDADSPKRKESNDSRLAHGDGSITRTECGAKLQSKEDDDIHYRLLRVGEREYECSLCSRRFVHKTHLRDHVASVHYKLNKALCPECGKSFVSRSKVNRHVLAVHRKQKRHSCEVCGRSFFQKWDLKKHCETHQSQR